MVSELNPVLMRHVLLRDAGQAQRMRCNTLTGQQVVTSASEKNLIRPLSQSVQYLAPPFPSAEEFAKSMTPIGSCDDSYPAVQVELSLVYVTASAQLLVHIHRLSNVESNSRYAKEFGTRIKVYIKTDIEDRWRNCIILTFLSILTHRCFDSRHFSRKQVPITKAISISFSRF